jgi:hypothetical protein
MHPASCNLRLELLIDLDLISARQPIGFVCQPNSTAINSANISPLTPAFFAAAVWEAMPWLHFLSRIRRD